MLKWYYPGDSGVVAGSTIGLVRVTTTLEYDGSGFVTLSIRAVYESVSKLIFSVETDDRVEIFLVFTSRLVFSLINSAFVVKILISKIKG